MVMLNKESNAILQRKLPPKLKDTRSFHIPCSMANLSFGKALCVLGPRINLMSLSVLKRLRIREVKPTIIT